jgi:hypothetical protein
MARTIADPSPLNLGFYPCAKPFSKVSMSFHGKLAMKL